MRNGRFYLLKCRGKVQKMGVLYIYSSKMPSPSPNFIIIPKKKKLKILKNLEKGGDKRPACSLLDYGLVPIGDRLIAGSPA